MQAFSSFSWMPDFMQSQHERMACSKPRPNPVVNLPLLNTLKRKRTDSWHSPSPAEEAHVKRQRPNISRQPSQTPDIATSQSAPNAPAKKEEATQSLPSSTHVLQPAVALPSTSRDVPDDSQKCKILPIMEHKPKMRAKVMEKIESQLNLEILLKHDELRLIEQELAKCQIALEQLRRCHVIPYAGQPGSFITAEQVSTGTGPALDPSAGLIRPAHPAPWGVTDGPYTRHYAKWLIPDAAFDPTLPQPASSHVGRKSIGGRSTRRTETDGTRAARGSVASPLYANPQKYEPVKDRNNNGPLLATRPSDGKLVRLVCRFCNKENASSMQGFLNHCRIQHKHEYTSHGAAADDCGILVESGEVFATAPHNDIPTPISATIPAASKPVIHPLIVHPPAEHRNDIFLSTSTPASATFSRLRGGDASIPPKPSTQYLSDSTATQASPAFGARPGPFVPSSLTPGLSALLQKRGVSGDLQSLVLKATDKSDIDNICQQLPSDDEKEEAKPVTESKASEAKPKAKPKVRRHSVQAPARANPGSAAPTSVPKLKLVLRRDTNQNIVTVNSPGTIPMTAPPLSSSTFDFAQPNFTSSPHVPSPAVTTSAKPPTISEHSPMSFDEPESLPHSPQHNTHDHSSPHTDTNPGLVSDYDDEDDDDRLTFATSSIHGDDAGHDDSMSHSPSATDMPVRVHDHEEDNTHVQGRTHHVRNTSQDHQDVHRIEKGGAVKSPEPHLHIRGGNFHGLERGGARRGRGRQRGSAGTGRGKGAARRTAKQDR